MTHTSITYSNLIHLDRHLLGRKERERHKPRWRTSSSSRSTRCENPDFCAKLSFTSRVTSGNAVPLLSWLRISKLRKCMFCCEKENACSAAQPPNRRFIFTKLHQLASAQPFNDVPQTADSYLLNLTLNTYSHQKNTYLFRKPN